MAAPSDAPPLLEPRLQPDDPAVRYWLAQVTLRLRREIAWCWHQRGAGAAAPAGQLPPVTDAAQDSLDLLRHRADKQAFFESDVTARHLTQQIQALEATQRPGLWCQMVQTLQLREAAQFVLACALAARADASMGPVAAAAANDAARPFPTLALVQRLWDEPQDIVACAEPTHRLWRSGLLLKAGAGDWGAALQVPAAVAAVLLGDGELPGGLAPCPLAQEDGGTPISPAHRALARWLETTPIEAMQLVPVQILRGADTSLWAGVLARDAGAQLAVLAEDITPQHADLPGLACAAWLHGVDLLAPDHWAMPAAHPEAGSTDWIASVAAIPLRWWVPVSDAAALRQALPALVAPAMQVPPLPMSERARRLREAVQDELPPGDALDRALEDATEAARRFRIQDKSLSRVERVLRSQQDAWSRDDLLALLQAEAAVDMTQLAQAVTPRFALRELILPRRSAQQLQAIVQAMRTLHRVHYEWGCGTAWNEGGLAVMFCGPPGTGKTMGAEALASELRLPMYRIDLSQVINKYIGETEKNLRRIFDAAETSDCLLFFDEADALFGKRTEVKDAHDRFANIEVSYLLERMERFKGLAVLATNRRKELDEAFVRRLRYIIEFPVPGLAERLAIWKQVFPSQIDVKAIDFEFLAERFELAGGAIRSVAFNACGQAAVHAREPRVAMDEVLVAVKRELEKSGREVADEQFAHYAGLVADMEGGSR